MDLQVPAVQQSSVAVTGRSERFPVHRIYCVGRNYAEHAREMGSDPTREPPFFFSKPADAVVGNESSIRYASRTTNLHYEGELVVAIGKAGSDIAVEGALSHVFGYAVGIDLTRRDLQNQAKNTGRPWDVGKGFDDSAPIASIRPVSAGGHVVNAAIWLRVNGETKQHSNTAEMIWSVAEIIAELSTLYVLKPGDLIFTGTPLGVGPLNRGDRVEAGVDGLESLSIRIV